jgi:ATP-dependent RNA helicase RhlE
MAFTSLSLHPDLLRAVRELGFQRPTPIQEKAIPPALLGKDILACAMTGSGKTAAFVLPILHRLLGKPRGTTRALVLTPTRELAAQIHAHLEELAVHTPVTGAPIFGGVGMGPQEHAFRSGVDVLIATPGRLLDHMRRPYARLNGIEVLVLDEADRMLDMGFLPDIRRVLKALPARRQNLMFSATVPKEIMGLTREILHDPVTLDLERKSAPAVGITQAVYPVHRERKTALLVELLRRGIVEDAIVFTRTKHRANRVADFLERQGIAAAKIHGNRSQSQRTAALDGFKQGTHKVLVATDIAARGIDVEELGHVVNFDVPADPHAYVHRVGRTARAGQTGDAFTFVSPEEEGELRDIERVLGARLPRVTLPDFDASKAKSDERLEIPIGERLAAMRAQRSQARARKPAGSAPHARPRGSASAPPRPPRAAAQRGAPGGRGQSRVDAILDRHAPLSEKPAHPMGRRRR